MRERSLMMWWFALLLSALAWPALTLAQTNDCTGLPTHSQLQDALNAAVQQDNGGIFSPNKMWATVVNRFGVVCAVAKAGDAWPGSRVISAQKANTANAFSNNGLALSTANLYTATQPEGSLYGLQHSNPVDPRVGYRGDPTTYGTATDPMNGLKIGGINVFGGGLPLYARNGTTVVGGLGVSGDSSCADHNIAWRMRLALDFRFVPGGVSAKKDDQIIYDIVGGVSAGGFGHPDNCPNGAAARAIAEGFAPMARP